MAEYRRRKSDRRDHPAPVDEGSATERLEQRMSRGPDAIPYGADEGAPDYERDVLLGSQRSDLDPLDEIDEIERMEENPGEGEAHGPGRDF